jgi:hypothetical protein
MMSSLHSECGDGFEFFGEWDAEGFIKLLEDARKMYENDEKHILDILGEIRRDDVDKAGTCKNTIAKYG